MKQLHSVSDATLKRQHVRERENNGDTDCESCKKDSTNLQIQNLRDIVHRRHRVLEL